MKRYQLKQIFWNVAYCIMMLGFLFLMPGTV
jgi:hypothetical protein